MFPSPDHLATPSEAIAEFGRNAGMDRPDQCWLLHNWDVWVRNPFYVGPPIRHPEDDHYGDDAEFIRSEAPLPADDDIPSVRSPTPSKPLSTTKATTQHDASRA